ncbi:uncharacterized protein BO80DRAFT_420639 [Aspergillus ibericus CBS 121593]|uniref:Letm1 RBD domain-containing protein n=1 Tax=Aspergillus ibericus CBS 121593 TaxID=1448316 RepID=A0A395HEP2_9EURO|nr:hypothetical protein BO80DRAFT_420639 [Aspergillus ibericus CBS 121593]RAL06342.1 hypothetical protein BO80DRAFT_420639 [Aspergillus ibericus CBS 121593]
MPSALLPQRALLRPPPSSTLTIVASLLQSHHHYNIQSRTYASHSPKSQSKSKSHSRPSSSAQPAHPSSTSTSTTSTTTLTNDINPPASTRPADLSLPPSLPPSASPADKLKHYISIGRAYLTFYKTGLKNVYHNYRAAQPLHRTLNLSLFVSPPATTTSASSFLKTLHSHNLSRAHFQLLRRSAYDIRRIIPFSLVLVICGEMTPLAVLALGNVITPLTCRIPRQLEKERVKRAVWKRNALVPVGSVTAPTVGSEAEMRVLKSMVDGEWVRTAGARDVLRACAALGLTKTHTRPESLVEVVYRPRLRRYAEYLEVDDALIRSGGGVSGMEAAEVRLAVEERGGVGVGGKESWEAEREERRWLEKWLAGKE